MPLTLIGGAAGLACASGTSGNCCVELPGLTIISRGANKKNPVRRTVAIATIKTTRIISGYGNFVIKSRPRQSHNGLIPLHGRFLWACLKAVLRLFVLGYSFKALRQNDAHLTIVRKKYFFFF